jgi:GalNAc-alpha-(1->4)-GalNAc-alpha-(1->3)-diNAcBac-PP-undecaprenol alpha-1,4-N-acetyl-D-galactosaminyltransferase
LLRISFAIASLRAGGAERVAILLANAWSLQGHRVSVITLEKPGITPAYPLLPTVELVPLDLTAASGGFASALGNNWTRIRSLRRCLRKLRPDVTVSFVTETNVLAILAGLGTKQPIVVSERVHPAHHPLAQLWARLRQLTYGKAAAVVVQSGDIAQWMEEHVGVASCVIANPVDLAKFDPGARTEKVAEQRKQLLAVGRLAPQKGFDILIEAFALAAASIPEWDLSIYGDGPMKTELENQIAARGLEDRVFLMASVSDIVAVYRSADAFVHPARYEGYPNVILEALASGLPVIAANSEESIRELLGNGKYGVLCDSESSEALAQALTTTLSESERLGILGASARQAVAANSIDKISAQWIDLFREIIRQ